MITINRVTEMEALMVRLGLEAGLPESKVRELFAAAKMEIELPTPGDTNSGAVTSKHWLQLVEEIPKRFGIYYPPYREWQFLRLRIAILMLKFCQPASVAEKQLIAWMFREEFAFLASDARIALSIFGDFVIEGISNTTFDPDPQYDGGTFNHELSNFMHFFEYGRVQDYPHVLASLWNKLCLQSPEPYLGNCLA